jgi:hypothetical protein
MTPRQKKITTDAKRQSVISYEVRCNEKQTINELLLILSDVQGDIYIFWKYYLQLARDHSITLFVCKHLVFFSNKIDKKQTSLTITVEKTITPYNKSSSCIKYSSPQITSCYNQYIA